MARRSNPEVNAGSMADIAFLLLIFFLVTTTFDKDTGVTRTLPKWNDDATETEQTVEVKQKNLFKVIVDKKNQLLVEDELMDIKDLRAAAIAFIDNGGGRNNEGQACSYCRGARDPESSDHPAKAIIALQNDRETSYETFLKIQDELGAAYNFLYDREAERLYGKGKTYTALSAIFNDPQVRDEKLKAEIDVKLKKVRAMYPRLITEAEAKNK